MLLHLHPNTINHLHDAECVKYLGKGAFGVVKLYQCKEKVNGCKCNQLFAVKHMKCNKFNPDKYTVKKVKKLLLNEYTIGTLLHHPNIRETLDIDLECNALICEYCPGIDFFSYIKYEHPSIKDEILYFKQFIDGVAYMHTVGIAHMDLKLENIMVDNVHKTIKIIDLGNSRVFHDSLHIDTVIPEKGIHGTLPYIPPEEFENKEYNPEKVDVWSSGIILFEIIYHLCPWHKALPNDCKYRYYLSCLKIHTEHKVFPEEISRNLLVKMLTPNPGTRPRIEEIKEELNVLDNINVHFNIE